MAEVLPLTSIRTDGNTQVRMELSEVVIREYAEAFERGDTFPPVEVYFDGTNHWLADGFHRVKAATQIGQETIEVIVHQGGQREALLHAAGANLTHGLRRSNADKHKAVMTLLADRKWRQWSDRQIARHCGVDGKSVAKLRKELTAEIRSESSDDSKRTYRTKHGTVATMNTARIGPTQSTRPAKIITLPTDRTREAPGTHAGAPSPPASSASAVVPQREVVAPTLSPPVESPTVVDPQPAQQEEPVAMPPVPALVRAWEQASEAERQEFVTQHRAVLLELLASEEKQEEPVHALPPDVHPDTQPGLILIVLRTATAPLSQEELAQVPGINRRVLGRDLTRLCKTERIEKTTDGRYVLRVVSQ